MKKLAGIAGPGKTIDPRSPTPDREPDEPPDRQPRPAPAPGVPVSNEEYERLKERAKRVRQPPAGHAREDPAEAGSDEEHA